MGEEELGVEVGGPVAIGIVIAQFGLERQRRQSEETLLRRRLSVTQHILAQLKVIVLPRYTVPTHK